MRADMAMSPSPFGKVFDDVQTRRLGAAYAMACLSLDADGDGAEDLRIEIAAALIEVAEDGVFDSAETLAQAAVDLVYVDCIEVELQ
jgi:hypothetical protein